MLRANTTICIINHTTFQIGNDTVPEQTQNNDTGTTAESTKTAKTLNKMTADARKDNSRHRPSCRFRSSRFSSKRETGSAPKNCSRECVSFGKSDEKHARERSLVGRTPKGAYSTRGRSRQLLETPLLRTPSENPSQNPFLL